MNKERRKKLAGIISTLNEIDMFGLEELTSAKDDLESLKDEEQEAYDNMPESLQNSDRGQTMQAGIEAMEEAIGKIETLIEAMEVEDIVSTLEGIE